MHTLMYLAATLALVHGHGYLTDPPNRSSMWRFGYNTPPNWDDNQLWCGGIGVQHQTNKGDCGPCGDAANLPRPRSNENGGTFGRGIVTRRYRAGQEITASVKLTANHKGWFRFSVCKLNWASQIEENSCFSALQLADGSGTQYKLQYFEPGMFYVRVRLPAGLTCSRCVLQWHYTAGNSWGQCPGGGSAAGCGPQETFRSCADIAIDP